MNNRFYPTLLALGLMVALRPALGATVYVAASGGDDTRTGLDDWTNAVATISQGVAKAAGFYTDIVLVSNGIYNLAATVAVTNGITVRGFAGREQTFISGGGTTRCFYLNNGGILDGLTISNGYNITNGGGAYISSTGYVYNCTFTNNVVGNFGGGVYINTAGLLTNCLFVGNVATGPVTSGAGGSGGGIYIASQGVVSNCEFSLNVSSNINGYGGGGVYAPAGANAAVYGSYFYTNTAWWYGGGAFVQYIYNCTFVSNWGNAGGGGAAIRTFASNCVFTYNCSIGSSAGYGGGCLVDAGAALVNCTNISYNIGYRGGGVFLGSGSTGAYLNVFSNANKQSGGGVYIQGGLLSNSFVTCNSATGAGGAVLCYNNNGRVVDCVISNNYSGGSGGGGIFYSIYSGNTGVIQRCTIVNNTAGGSPGNGGGISFGEDGYANVPVRRCVIGYNTTASGGGGLYVNMNTGQVENCLIYSNSAGTSGGGVYMMRGTNLLVNCTIVSNTAASSGGGIYAAGANNRVINTIVYYNSAMLYGTNAVAFTNSCLTTTNGINGDYFITNNPQFVNITAGNFRLSVSSPCINAGTNEAWMEAAVDLQGRPRIYYGRADIGGYEYFLNVKVNGIPIDRIKRINGVDKHRIIRINQ